MALQVLYACEMVPDNQPGPLMTYLVEEDALGNQAQLYGKQIVEAVRANHERIDEIIKEHSANWDIRRMAATDRNVLRIAVAELLFSPDIPYRVVIDEAVEVAKTYGTDDSGKFVNGVIDAIHRAGHTPQASR